MSLKITGIDWQSVLENKNRPTVIGIEGLMVSVMISYQKKRGRGLFVFVQILRITTHCSKQIDSKLFPGCFFKGVLYEEKIPAVDCHGFLKAVAK